MELETSWLYLKRLSDIKSKRGLRRSEEKKTAGRMLVGESTR
jgi:hypothetical protein